MEIVTQTNIFVLQFPICSLRVTKSYKKLNIKSKDVIIATLESDGTNICDNNDKPQNLGEMGAKI